MTTLLNALTAALLCVWCLKFIGKRRPQGLDELHRYWRDQVRLRCTAKLRLFKYRTYLASLVKRSGANASSDDLVAEQLLGAAYGLLLGLTMWWFLSTPFIFSVLGAAVMGFVPVVRLQDLAAKRIRGLASELASLMDFMALSMNAGVGFKQALRLAQEELLPSVVREEVGLLIKRNELGSSLEESFMELERRLPHPLVRSFVQTMVQAMRMGTDLSQTLLSVSDQMQRQRFVAAEESAGKASVKMMIPMMMFVMPASVIIILGPMILDFVRMF